MRAVREACVLLLVAAAPAGLATRWHPGLADESRAGLEPGAVRLSAVRDWHTEVLWIDGRSEADFAQDHIPGALHADEAHFSEHIGEILAAWHSGERIVVYCSSLSCGTSKALAQQLRDAGFADVYYLHGGWEAWIAAGR